jgi:phosphate acyltransferase
MKIAVDAMGGDFGPAVVVEGAVTAAREFGLASVLVGDKAAVE